MKQFLRLLLAAGLLAFAVSMTATSCGKAADPNNNNNNNNANNNSGGSGGDGGDGNGGGTPTPTPKPPPTIIITNADTGLVKVKDETNILLKASAFPTSGVGDINNDDFKAVISSSTGIKKAFEFVHSKTSEGMLLVGKGNVANAGAITTAAFVEGLNNYPTTVAGSDSIQILISRTGRIPSIPTRLSFVSAFGNRTNPTSTAEAAADAAPFAFSRTSGTSLDVHPVFWCVATASAITTTRPAATHRFNGAHRAVCYVASKGFNLGGGGTGERNWFNAAQPFKREILVAVSAISTDGKTIGNLFSGADAAAKLANFTDGIDATEMAAIVAASSTVFFKKYSIKIVKDADF